MRNKDFYIEFYEVVDRVIDEYLSLHAVPTYVGTALFEGSYELKKKYNGLRMGGMSLLKAKKIVKKTLLPEYEIDRSLIMPAAKITLPGHMDLLGSRLAVYLYNTRQLKYLLPFINTVNRPMLLLCEESVDLCMDMPEYVEAIELDYSIAEAFVKKDNMAFDKLAKCYTILNSIISGLRLEGVVLLEGCHYQEQIIGELCRQHGIPSILIQQGWPSVMHTMFRRFPYSHFLTWGKEFDRLWKAFNPDPEYCAVGYPYKVKKKQDGAISFFLQAPLFISDSSYYNLMIELAEKTAEKYSGHTVLIREHPEFPMLSSKRRYLESKPNIVFVTDRPLSDVFAYTSILVAHFSSSLVEGIAHGCIPLAFDPTTESKYNPDLEEKGIGCFAKTFDDFFYNLDKILFDTDSYFKKLSSKSKNWFSAVGHTAALNQAVAVNRIAPPETVAGNYRYLNLGCGRNLMPGWLNVDLYRESPQVFQMDASRPFPFADNYFDYVFSEHMFEHLDLSGQQNMLRECFRVLNTSGVLRVAMPDFDFLVDLINNPNTDTNSRYLEWSYSRFVSPKLDLDVDRINYPVYVVNNFMRDWGHNFIHTRQSLIQMGKSCGFSYCKICSIGISDHAVLRGCERHQNEIPDWANHLETMVLEFYK